MGRDRCRRDIPVESQRMCPHGRSVRKKRGRDMDGERERGCKSTQGRRADCERSSATAFPIYHRLYVPWYHGRALQTPDNVHPGMRKGAPSTLRHATLHKRHSRTSDTNAMSTNAPASLLRALPPSHSEVFGTTGSALTRTAGRCVGRSRLHLLATPGARRRGNNGRNKRRGRDIHEWVSTPLLCSSILSREACMRLGRRCSFPVYPTTLQPKPTAPILRPAFPRY
ncbi:hypothetical protein B0H13DRAFT_592489 [Mycena leptocephala]|nr:hypothetical protein B0H13DRAFT_592489 [Mycena leptocephala]